MIRIDTSEPLPMEPEEYMRWLHIILKATTAELWLLCCDAQLNGAITIVNDINAD